MRILDLISKQDKVLILGFAREGQSTLKFLKTKFPLLQIDTADQKDDPNYLARLQDYQLVIKTPGISPHKPEIEAAKKAGVVFTSHMQIFLEACPSQKTIGVSGTKGKSTTTSLIYALLSAHHLPAVLVGNIGTPALDFLPEITADTWVVMELSSYQLMELSVSPHIAVMQNIFPDHLDYHLDFAEYVSAKQNLVRYQSDQDLFIYNSANDLCLQTAALTVAKKIPFTVADFPQVIHTQLLGIHNRLNILPSWIIAQNLHLPEEISLQAIADFSPLDTRLNKVAVINGVEFYEDTLATIPEATIAAISALQPSVTTLIAGGHDRKQNYSELAKKILDSNIKTLIVFPSTGPRIWSEITSINPQSGITYFYTESMQDAVKLALDHTVSGQIVLLSPAAPSFTLFKDYRDESQQYRQHLQLLSGTSSV